MDKNKIFDIVADIYKENIEMEEKVSRIINHPEFKDPKKFVYAINILQTLNFNSKNEKEKQELLKRSNHVLDEAKKYTIVVDSLSRDSYGYYLVSLVKDYHKTNKSNEELLVDFFTKYPISLLTVKAITPFIISKIIKIKEK